MQQLQDADGTGKHDAHGAPAQAAGARVRPDAGNAAAPRSNHPQARRLMKVEVRLFARAKDLAGVDRVALELTNGAKVSDLRAALGKRVPALRSLLPNLLVAINNDFAGDQQ